MGETGAPKGRRRLEIINEERETFTGGMKLEGPGETGKRYLPTTHVGASGT